MIEMSLGYGGYWSGVMPVGDIETGLPFGWRNSAEAASFFYNFGFLDLLRAAYAEHNVYYIGPILDGPYCFMSRDPISSLDDMKRMTARIAGPSADVLAEVGVSTTYIPAGELYLAVSTGVVDAFALGSPVTYNEMKLYEVAKYLINPPIVDPLVCNLLINMDVWNALPDDLKVIIEQVSLANNERNNAYWQIENSYAIDKMTTENGVSSMTLPPEDVLKLTEASFGVWDEFAAKDATYAGPAVKMLKDFVKLMGHIN